jgi:microcystin-dependent protein
MSDPVTVNRSLAIPLTGSDPGSWGPVINGDFNLLDTIVGGIASISTTGGDTTLNAAQLACGTITVSGLLTSNARLVFPAVQGWWSIQNLTTGAFYLGVISGLGTEQIAIPPGQIIDIQINANAVRFRNLPMVGSYLDVGTTSIPLWIISCSNRPYLNCDGSSFSAVTYPYLAAILGGTTLPDFRGVVPAYLNQGTGRITTAGSGIDGNTLLAKGGTESVTLTANQIPSITSANASQNITVLSNQSGIPSGAQRGDALTNASGGYYGPASLSPLTVGQITSQSPNSISVTSNNTGGLSHPSLGPTTISGLRLIRAG